MKRIAFVMMLAVVVCMAVTTESFAQGRGGRGGRGGFGGFGGFGGGGSSQIAGFINNEAIQEEIELEDFQLESIQEAIEDLERPQFDFRALRDLDEDERREKMQEIGEQMSEFSEKQVEVIKDILSEKQMKRLQEIEVQMAGIRAIQIPRVAEELDLTKTQKQKVEDAFTDMMSEMREAFTGGRGRGGDMREKMEEMQEQLEEDVMDILSSKQRDKLEDMKGDEFDTSQLRRGRGGRGGQGGGRGGRGGRGERGGRPQTDDGDGTL